MYIAVREMTLNGVTYKTGDAIDASVLSERQLSVMLGLRRLIFQTPRKKSNAV